MFSDLAKTARSTRRFAPEPAISADDMRTLVDLARVAPCGGNQQPLRYRIVSDPKERAAIFPAIAWAGALKDWAGPAEGERPTGYLVIASAGDHGTDVGIAAQTIQLAAADMGYGCCMLGAIRRPAIQQELQIPQDYTIDLLLALGKPAETIVLEDVAGDAPLKYYRDSDDVHHVPKLSLDSVLLS